MTLPIERANAVLHTEKFLLDLCNAKSTPKVPSAIRDKARSLLRHYPTAYYVEMWNEMEQKAFDQRMSSGPNQMVDWTEDDCSGC